MAPARERNSPSSELPAEAGSGLAGIISALASGRSSTSCFCTSTGLTCISTSAAFGFASENTSLSGITGAFSAGFGGSGTLSSTFGSNLTCLITNLGGSRDGAACSEKPSITKDFDQLKSHPWAPNEARKANAYHPLIELEFRRCELGTACMGKRMPWNRSADNPLLSGLSGKGENSDLL